jgi:peptidoglycan/LPS O-acetylase OafA/YrhL
VNRFKQIDILRAGAVFLVLGRHMEPCPRNISPLLHHITAFWAKGGWVGVDLFFVLSGFLVSGLLFREYEKYSKLDLPLFLIRRGFKIYPAFWLLIAVTETVRAWYDGHLSVPSMIAELLFVQNYWQSMWNHTWSLAVEEHFYLLLAIGALLLTRRRAVDPFKIVPSVFVIIASLCLALRLVTAAYWPFSYQTNFFPTHLRLDSLFFGVLLSYLYHAHTPRFLSFARRFRGVLFAVGTLCLLTAFFFPLRWTTFMCTYGFTLLYFGSGCLLVSSLGIPTPANFFANAIAYIGSHSYSIYLWHMPVAIWGTALVAKLFSYDRNWFNYAFTYLAGSIVFGISMALLVEFPFLRLRDRLFPSRGAALRNLPRRETRHAQPSGSAT